MFTTYWHLICDEGSQEKLGATNQQKYRHIPNNIPIVTCLVWCFSTSGLICISTFLNLVPRIPKCGAEEKHVCLTGVWVLSTGIWGLTSGRAVYRGGGGRQKLGADVWSLTQLISTNPSRMRSRRVRLLSVAEGWLRRLLWWPLLVQLHSLTDCIQTHT